MGSNEHLTQLILNLKDMEPIHSSSKFILVTKSDTALLQYHSKNMACRGIMIGTAGDLAVKDDEGTTVVIPSNALAVGIIHPICTSQVMSTGTTCSEIVAFF